MRQIETYEVVRAFWLKGALIAPAPTGQPPRTLRLTPAEARYLILDGAVKGPVDEADEG